MERVRRECEPARRIDAEGEISMGAIIDGGPGFPRRELGRRLANVLTAGEDFGHPMMAPPGVPAERVKLLRDAYAKTLKDPELLVDVKKQEYDFDPVSGDELQTLAKTVVNQPAQVIERLKKILGN